MTLESLLKPMKWIDEQLLRQHTKLAKFIEDKKGISKNTLSDILSGVSVTFGMLYSVNHLMNDSYEIKDYPYQYIEDAINLVRMTGIGNVLNIASIRIGNAKDETENGSIAIYPVIDLAKKMFKTFRLPGFITGASGISYSLYEILASNGNFTDNVDLLILGSFVTLGASALYIKDADPKLLEKQPFWKDAYYWAKEKLSSLIPEPPPQPVPVRAYSTLNLKKIT